MPYLLGVLILVLLTVAILYLMRRGWRNRARKIVITELPELPPGPTGAEESTPGIYVTTTLAGMPYERVVTRGLGVKSAVDVYVRAAGVLLQRQGSRDLFIPRVKLTNVSTTSGMIGKFAAANSIVVLTWTAGNTPVDTGIHIRNDDARARLLNQLTSLLRSPNETETA